MTGRDPRLRASDADREQVAGRLREHFAAGRLDVEEFKERLDAVYAARTMGELAALTCDLPEPGPFPLARPQPARPPAPRSPDALLLAWRAWASTAAIVITMWVITVLTAGELLYFWPAWVIGPSGAALLAWSLVDRAGGSGR